MQKYVPSPERAYTCSSTFRIPRVQPAVRSQCSHIPDGIYMTPLTNNAPVFLRSFLSPVFIGVFTSFPACTNKPNCLA